MARTLAGYKFKEVEQELSTISQEKIQKYKDYWNSIKPASEAEHRARWLFAYLSIHTTWQRNVMSFNILRREDWVASKIRLENLIKQSGVGLHKTRVEGIWRFYHDRLLRLQTSTNPKSHEDWVELRNTLTKECFGIGITKTAFALELCYPTECQVVCLDTHAIRMYGGKSHVPGKDYLMLEKHWVETCNRLNLPSPIARHILWDKTQKKEDTRYWSYVFESPVDGECQNEIW